MACKKGRKEFGNKTLKYFFVENTSENEIKWPVKNYLQLNTLLSSSCDTFRLFQIFAHKRTHREFTCVFCRKTFKTGTAYNTHTGSGQ